MMTTAEMFYALNPVGDTTVGDGEYANVTGYGANGEIDVWVAMVDGTAYVYVNNTLVAMQS
jgi:hypothetical protein